MSTMPQTKHTLIARRIDELGASYSTIAEHVGVTKQTIGLWAAGSRAPNGKYMTKLAEVLGVTVELLAQSVSA